MWSQTSPRPPDCPQCPRHVLTGADAAVSYPRFCEAFGFPVGPSGSRALLAFYELWGAGGELLQSGQASGCPAQGRHPETLLFDAQQGYLSSVLAVCEEVCYILLYSNYSPCQEPASQCCLTLQSFLQQHPWVRLDLLFSQLYRTQPPQPYSRENRGGLRSLAALWPRLTLSPISGGAWGHLLRRFVRDAPPWALRRPLLPGRVEADRANAVQISAITGVGPVFLDLPVGTHAEPPPPVPPPHLLPPPPTLSAHPGLGTSPLRPPELPPSRAPPRPVNVVRHIRMPPPPPRRHHGLSPRTPLSRFFNSPLSTLLPPGGRRVEVVHVTEREVANDRPAQDRDSKKVRTSKGR